MSTLLIVSGIIFSAYGFILCIMSNLNLGVMLTFMLGLGILIWGIYYNKIKEITSKGVMKGIKNIILILLAGEVLLIGFISSYGMNDSVTYREDAVIVLGAGVRGDKVTIPLKTRLDKAIEYHKVNPEALIVVSGGKGYQETVTEAFAMEKYLIENGVNPNVIIKEERAESTAENMRFSKKILDEMFDDEHETLVITNRFHTYRGVSLAKKEGFENVTHMGSSIQWYNLIPCYLRESLAILKMWLLD